MGNWERRSVASCFIWAQLDLIFKWWTEAESVNAVTMVTELMGHTHSNMNDRAVCVASVIAARETRWCGRDQSRARQQSALGEVRHLGSVAGLIHLEELPQREERGDLIKTEGKSRAGREEGDATCQPF